MPMGVVDSTEFEEQLNNVAKPVPTRNPVPSNPTPLVEGEIVESNKGRNKGDVNVPTSMQALIAGVAATEGREEALQLGKALGISSSSVSAYSNGATSTKSYNQPKSGILEVIRTRKTHASKKALRKLHSALDNIEETELANLGARHLASIAKDLAGVVKIMTPEEVSGSGPSVVFQLFAPPTRPEHEFEVIQVNE